MAARGSDNPVVSKRAFDARPEAKHVAFRYVNISHMRETGNPEF
jgi:hypothetical protein